MVWYNPLKWFRKKQEHCRELSEAKNEMDSLDRRLADRRIMRKHLFAHRIARNGINEKEAREFMEELEKNPYYWRLYWVH